MGIRLTGEQKLRAIEWFREHRLSRYEVLGRVVRFSVLDELDVDGNFQFDLLVNHSVPMSRRFRDHE